MAYNYSAPFEIDDYDPASVVPKQEPDLTIPLGWNMSTSISFDSVHNHNDHNPSLSPELGFEHHMSSNPSFDVPGSLFDSNSAIPWSRWTELDQDHCDMPQTPVDAFPMDFNFYTHSSGSEMHFIDPHTQIIQNGVTPKLDLLSPFTSMALESPPLSHQTCQPGATSYASPPEPPLFYDTQALVNQYESTASPVRNAGSNFPVQTMHKRGESDAFNPIPTLSSSLPSSLATPPPISTTPSTSSSSGTKSSRLSPPAHGIRSRSRAYSDASEKPHPRLPTRRRKDDPAASGGLDTSNPLKPPKQSLSTWQIFFTDWIARQDANGGRKLNVAQAAKEAGKEYKLLSDKEKEPYARRAAEARLDRQQALSNWHSTLTPSLIALENRYRSAQRKLGLSRRSNLKDPNAPKKPLSAYFMFLKAVREDEKWSERVFEGEKETTKQSVMAAVKWREMSDDEKRPFLARAEQEKLEYEAARKEYEDAFNHSDSSLSLNASSRSSKSSRPRSNSTGSSAMAFRLDTISSSLSSSVPMNSSSTTMMTSNGMGYFSTNTMSLDAIPIHIPKRARSAASPASSSSCASP